ncbi:DgyrCDS2649 [Dimorphilus gyrociliatus]|nr:DgyrCDS2649 [Dimorphilus gyrociliatus]
MTSNPFSGSASTSNDNSDGILQNNPFAERINTHSISSAGNSDSEDDRNKPIVAPAHFQVATAVNSRGSSSSSFKLRPSALSKHTEGIGKGICVKTLGDKTKTNDNKENASNSKSANGTVDSDKQNGNSPDETSSSNNASSSCNFVFGQNLEDRVMNTPVKSDKQNGNGSKSPTDLSFNTAPELATEESTEDESKTLLESAAEYAAKQSIPELQEVETITGEENESNVLQINAKLYVFEKSSGTWLERGRGVLRLNDIAAASGTDNNSAVLHSRLVMRTQGSLRLVLNSKIWSSMTVERANTKSVRITAADGDDGVKVCLIVTSVKDADQIFSAIDWRVQQLRSQEQREASTSATTGTSSENFAAKRTRPFEDEWQTENTSNTTGKKFKTESYSRTEESNDSSTVDPETEASNSSVSSSPPIKSSSSE